MRHLRYVLIMGACVGMSLGVVFAQDKVLSVGTLRGHITDLTPAQNPVEGVEVKIVAQDGGKEFITETDAKGNYKHALLPAGRYMISISKEGYDERVGRPVNVVKGGDHFIPLKMAKKGKIKMFVDVQRDERMNIVIKQRIVSLLQRVAEGVGKRYDLDEAAVKTLHQSFLDSIEGASESGGDLSVFAKPVEEGNISLLEMLLSHPVCQAAFAKHLSEAQLQDYLEFTEAREVRDRQAVVQWITAILDKELSLRTEQREKVVQSLLDATENELFPNSMNALRLKPQQAAQLMHYRLKISLDGILSEAQSKVWQGLVRAKANKVDMFIIAPEVGIQKVIRAEKINDGDVAAPNKRFVFIPDEPDKHVGIEKEFEVVIDDIMIDRQEQQPWIELNTNIAESQEQRMEIAEAKLVAHTELLGTLDERAARRLALVAKGVAQQHFEAHDETREALSREIEADLTKKVEDGKMTREEATAMLNFTLKNAMDELWGDGGPNIEITSHPLYQQAIKDVLSEEAFAAYSKHQTERVALHQQVLRDVVVACTDMHLLLDDTQRERLETAASQLVPNLLSKRSPSILMFFQLFPQTVDFEVLTAWQQTEFERVFGPMVWRR
ncbi:carboxypeptidase regulatory-like domain-containing protein [Candidatus Poribacteria bacterium]|nr:carboxypeptidase regulatory-like domain-containing protein [Candidatus Poribacteria bacterium]